MPREGPRDHKAAKQNYAPNLDPPYDESAAEDESGDGEAMNREIQMADLPQDQYLANDAIMTTQGNVMPTLTSGAAEVKVVPP